MPQAQIACPTCNGPIELEYCARCGERRPRPDDLSLRHLAGANARGIATTIGYALLLLIYRAALFFVTFWMT